MQKTQQQTISAEFVINKAWDYLNYLRGNFSFSEIFSSILTVLYAYHKDYPIRMIDSRHVEFIPNDDKLYRDLISQIPANSHLHKAMCQYMEDLSQIDNDEFNTIYAEVLKGLFDQVSYNSVRGESEFFTPTAITRLMAYIVDKEGCNEIFDPFCGTASIIHELSRFGGLPLFTGQEINFNTSIYARLNAEAMYGHDECITVADSITQWDDHTYDAVVTCPPFGLRLSQAQLSEASLTTPHYPYRCYEDILLTRPFHCNHSRLTVTLLPTGFCFAGNRNYYELRQELVEQNLLDTIIALPASLLYSTSIQCVLVICKRYRTEGAPVRFIHAEEYFVGERRKRVFDYDRFIEMIEGDACDVTEVSHDKIRQYDYNFNPSLYFNEDFKIKSGQRKVVLEELITPVLGTPIPVEDVMESVSINDLGRDFIEVLRNNSKVSTSANRRTTINYREIEASEGKYLLAFSAAGDTRYGINTDGKSFIYPADVKVYRINEELVLPEYLLYTIINHNSIGKGRMPFSGYMRLPLVIDPLNVQSELVNKEKQQYQQKVDAEREADALRLGVKQNVSDLEHMLGSTQLRISKIIARLEKETPSSEKYPHLVKSLKDNIEYMNRVIHYNNARIDSESFNKKEGDIAEFINSYVDAWNNYGGEYFELSVQNMLQDSVKMSFDRTLLTVMLDSILNNAIRHGYHKRKNYTEHNMVQIDLSAVEHNGRQYVKVTVANNGDPITEGFTIRDYVSRGRYTVSTGRSGLGGYHVYQIVKGHDGFLYLDSNKVWNMVVDILLPIDDTLSDDIPAYDNECI